MKSSATPRLRGRERRHIRIRKKVQGTAERPRLCVYRSLNHIYAQLVDDLAGRTIMTVSSLDKGLAPDVKTAKGKVAAGKIVVDAVVPLVPPKVSVVKLPPDGSAALIAQRLLAGTARVQAAFHNVSAAKLHSSGPVDCDVLVFGDEQAARAVVIELANAAGTRGVDGGPLANSAAAEALTSVLIGINRRYKVEGAGIRITGLPLAQR